MYRLYTYLLLALIAAVPVLTSTGCEETLGSYPDMEFADVTLEPGVVDQAYSREVRASGGDFTFYRWQILEGEMPAGVDLVGGTPEARFIGTPSEAGTFEVTLEASDRDGNSASAVVTILIREALTTDTSSIPTGVLGVETNVTINALGGSGSGYMWELLGTLPDGLAFTPNGASATVIGTPTTEGTYNFSIIVGDDTGAQTVTSYSMTVNPELAIDIPSALPDGAIDNPYSATVQATGGSGEDYTWSVTGSLPPGVSFDQFFVSASFTGTPTVTGTFPFDLSVTDSQSNNVTKSTSLTINEPIQIDTTFLNQVGFGNPIGDNIETTGGSGEFEWTVIAGQLPPGISFGETTPDLVFDGACWATGTFTFTLKVEDGGIGTDTATYTVNVVPATVRITRPELPSAQVNKSYNEAVTAFGGTGPYTWSIRSGSLPSGMSFSGSGLEGTLSGTPTQAGVYKFTVQVTDATNISSSHSYVFAVGYGRYIAYRGPERQGGVDEVLLSDISSGTPGTPQPVVTSQGNRVDNYGLYDFSPSGKWIAWVERDSNNIRTLYVRDASTATLGSAIRVSQDVPIQQSLDGVREFDWSPDGEFLVYTTENQTDGDYELYLVDMTGSTPATPTMISHGANANGRVQFDGSRIDGGTYYGFAISPDAKFVAFRGDRTNTNNDDIYVVDVSDRSSPGSPERVSTNLTGNYDAFMMNWAPNSAFLAFSAENSGNRNEKLYVVNVYAVASQGPQDVTSSVLGSGDSVRNDEWDTESFDFLSDSTAVIFRALKNRKYRAFYTDISIGSPGASGTVHESLPNNARGCNGFVVAPAGPPRVMYHADDFSRYDEEPGMILLDQGSRTHYRLFPNWNNSSDTYSFNGETRSISIAPDGSFAVAAVDDYNGSFSYEFYYINLTGSTPGTPQQLTGNGSYPYVYGLRLSPRSNGALFRGLTYIGAIYGYGVHHAPISGSSTSSFQEATQFSGTNSFRDTERASYRGWNFSPDGEMVAILTEGTRDNVDELFIRDVSSRPYPNWQKVNGNISSSSDIRGHRWQP